MAEFEGLKQFFGDDGNTAITYEQLERGIAEKGIKLADLSLGGYVSKDKFDEQVRKYNDYKSKNDVSKFADYDAIKQELDTLKAEKADRELMSKLGSKKVKSEFQKFVLSEIKAKVDDKTDFDKAMEDYLKENKQYIAEADPQPKPFFKNTTVPLENGEGENKTTNKIMNDMLREARQR